MFWLQADGVQNQALDSAWSKSRALRRRSRLTSCAHALPGEVLCAKDADLAVEGSVLATSWAGQTWMLPLTIPKRSSSIPSRV